MKKFNSKQTINKQNKLTTKGNNKMKKFITQNKQNPAREALRRLSAQIRARLNATGSNKTINEVLEAMYRAQSGQNDFDTFRGWKERGYSVEKGAKGYPIWSRPKARKDAGEIAKTETADGVDVETSSEKKSASFWVSYLFHAGQVKNENGDRPNTYGQTPRLALPIPQEYKNDMNIIQPPAQKPQAFTLREFEIMDDAEEVPQGAKEAQAEFVW